MSNSQFLNEHAWLKSADSACYEAKREGRGRVRVATMTA